MNGFVLVVEDNPHVRELAVGTVESLGFEAIGVSDGEGALALLADHPEMGLLFTDLVLAGRLSGQELVHESRRLYPKMPVLLTTGYLGYSKHFPGNLPSDLTILPKPYRSNDLSRALTTLGFSYSGTTSPVSPAALPNVTR